MDHDTARRSTREFWEEFYAEERLGSGRANPALVEIAGPLTPGRALDLGCGEGSDAIWLAEQGWQVTAADVSATVLGRAAARAGDTDAITWEQHDFAVSLPSGEYDLVSAQFLQSPVAFARAEVLRAAASRVAPGGLLLVVGHAAAPSWAHEIPQDYVFPTPGGDLADLGLDQMLWRTVHADTRSRQALGPDGTAGTMRDSVVAVVRAGAVTQRYQRRVPGCSGPVSPLTASATSSGSAVTPDSTSPPAVPPSTAADGCSSAGSEVGGAIPL